jgi:hypothetical protein
VYVRRLDPVDRDGPDGLAKTQSVQTGARVLVWVGTALADEGSDRQLTGPNARSDVAHRYAGPRRGAHAHVDLRRDVAHGHALRSPDAHEERIRARGHLFLFFFFFLFFAAV